jgi:phosphatidylinositol alpha-1,6-mannosyltransferase
VPTVLFVSKPIVPPFHDGTKCIVRDLATSLERVTPKIMSSPGAPPLARAISEPVYRESGRFRPSARQNLRALAWLLTRARADLWHFVFAPNVRTSQVGRVLKRVRRVPVVQTVASAPRSFVRASALLFGDVVVAQSAWTRTRFEQSFADEGLPRELWPRLEVIFPPLGPVPPRSASAQIDARRALDIPENAPVFVYPGDLETSSGAETVAAAVAGIAERVPKAVVVFAYRPKSAAAQPIAETLAGRVPARHVRFTSTLTDVLSLIAGSKAVLFPVDDLWGKVDLPIVLLESMALGVPVIALDQGPLSELEGVKHVRDLRPASLVLAVAELQQTPELCARIAAEQRAFIAQHAHVSIVSRAYESLYAELIS